jgi:hypothetical protein
MSEKAKVIRSEEKIPRNAKGDRGGVHPLLKGVEAFQSRGG